MSEAVILELIALAGQLSCLTTAVLIVFRVTNAKRGFLKIQVKDFFSVESEFINEAEN